MKIFTFLSLLCSLLASSASAQIFSNPITDSNPSASNPFTNGQTVAPNMTVTGIGRGSGISGNAGSNRYNANSWNTPSLDATAYFTFTLTPAAGFKINFSSFSYNGQASGTGPVNFAFRSSKDNYAANIGSPNENGTSIDLTGAAYQNLTSAITFRFYGWGASGATGTYSIDDFSFTGAVALPVELISFHGKKINDEVLLSFSTLSERSNSHFLIERASEGVQFAEIGRVAGAGDSDQRVDYTFTDEHPLPGVHFYRLKQVDVNGDFAYSPIISVAVGSEGGIQLFPQPVSDQLRISFDIPPAIDGAWQLFDLAGRQLQSGAVEAETSGFDLDTAALPGGSYVLRVVNGQQVIAKQFQKTR